MKRFLKEDLPFTLLINVIFLLLFEEGNVEFWWLWSLGFLIISLGMPLIFIFYFKHKEKK